jgi:F0F1-type ATP synthase assembly protein I
MWRMAGLLGAVGVEMAIAVFLGTYLGERADRLWGISPWGALGGFGMGIGAAIISLRRAVLSAKRLLEPGAADAAPEDDDDDDR